MSWTYKGKELTDDMIPDKSAGFIYLMTHLPTGRKYIGRKLLTSAVTRVKNKKKIRSRVESDWRDYYSSSPDIAGIIEEEGKEVFSREILLFCPNKATLNYSEECMLYALGALESEDYLNRNIRAKVFGRNIIGKDFVKDLRESINNLK